VVFQSVLAILVPEAEPLVGSFRNEYDSSAAAGMPAHITINYPFRPGKEVASSTVDKLKSLFSRHRSFKYSLIAFKRFPGILYLEPSPGRPLNSLIRAVVERFPESPPYGGMYRDIIPHLTVAAVEDEAKLNEISRRFAEACGGRLPIPATAREIWLMDNKTGSWIKRVSFPLAGHP
jgi:2'-5' RNA ligase